MEKIALVTDSSCGLPNELMGKYSVYVANLKIIYRDKEYLDGVDITATEVYSKLDKEVPTTSMPSVSDIDCIFKKIKEDGFTHVIVLPISSGLSGTINSFRLAAEMEEDLKIFIYDTKILSMAVGLMIMEVGDMVSNGFSYEEICRTIPDIRKRLDMYFAVDTLEYLIRGGRIGKVSGSLGQLLNLKPIITMAEDGSYETHAKVRGSKQAFRKIEHLIKDKLDLGAGKVVVMTGTMNDEADKMAEILSEHKNITFLHSGIITPAVGIHSGPRLLAVAVLRD